MSSINDATVAVLGGGVAGCAAALALARSNVSSVCLIEWPNTSVQPIGESIPPDTRMLLQQLGVWQEFIQQGHEPCLGSLSAWGSTHIGYNDFVLNPYGNGWHVSRGLFEHMLVQGASQAGVRHLVGRRFLSGSSLEAGGFILNLLGPNRRYERFRTRCVVDATGVGASFARCAGAQPLFLDHLCFIYGFFENLSEDKIHSTSTLLEATEDGWWYLAAVPGNRVAVAYATDPELLRTRRLQGYEQWMGALLRTELIAPRLNNHRILRQSLLVRPAPSFLLDRCDGPGWLAVGDAASAYDPIAAQGIYKALSTGIAAAHAIAAILRSETDNARAYSDSVSADFENYLTNRNLLYSYEQRWPDSLFWKLRHERSHLQQPGSTSHRSFA